MSQNGKILIKVSPKRLKKSSEKSDFFSVSRVFEVVYGVWVALIVFL